MSTESFVQAVKRDTFARLNLQETEDGVFAGQWLGHGPCRDKFCPIDGSWLGRVRQASVADYEATVAAAQHAFGRWRTTPAPKRGELVRRLGERLRALKEPLGRLVTLETGKILAEGEGEVQEMIDVCDFANGLSRQLYGLTMASERPAHRMFEQWHPLGLTGIISAFNFPVAVWSWNSAIAAVCGNACLWKPSEKTPFTAIACTKIAEQVCRAADVDPAIFCLLSGDASAGAWLAADARIPLVSATGSVRMGRAVGRRLARTLLELGGNNAVIVTPSANLELALRALLFGAVGTVGQRCTTTRRLIVHRSIQDGFVRALERAYRQIPIGNPLRPDILMGPLIDGTAVEQMQKALGELRTAGGRIIYGGDLLAGDAYPGGLYVIPCLAEVDHGSPVVQRETFAPILYTMAYDSLEEAIALHNGVPQGLSSAIFSDSVQEAERFLSATGSDCGIANVNLGTSGAEIGGAFGGEKDTGGGRESGSDAWKAYMRRQTATINGSSILPLAQGIRFEVGPNVAGDPDDGRAWG